MQFAAGDEYDMASVRRLRVHGDLPVHEGQAEISLCHRALPRRTDLIFDQPPPVGSGGFVSKSCPVKGQASPPSHVAISLSELGGTLIQKTADAGISELPAT